MLARPLNGWYTPEGLVALLKQDIDNAHAKLEREPTGYLDLRDYQIRAIQAVEGAIEGGKRACLVAMATGTGKTRTAIGLVYRLLKAQRFRRVLFLVDRSALGEQTLGALKDVRLENLQTFAEIYNIKGLEDARPDPGTKLHVATIQGMVKSVGAALPSAYLIRFRLVRSVVAPRFVLAALLTPRVQELLGLGATAVTQPNVNARTIERYLSPYAV